MYLAVQELAQRTTMVRALASVATSRSPALAAGLRPGRAGNPAFGDWVVLDVAQPSAA
jgi:hypothetical protein